MSTFRHSSSAINQLVYQLYGLTAEEIALVETATAPAAQSNSGQAATESDDAGA